jgi:capsular exopolysaccharide synthesis family protein
MAIATQDWPPPLNRAEPGVRTRRPQRNTRDRTGALWHGLERKIGVSAQGLRRFLDLKPGARRQMNSSAQRTARWQAHSASDRGEMPAADEFDLLELVGTLWRGKWIILGGMLLFAILAFVNATQVVQPVYRASATVAIEETEEPIGDLQSVVTGLSSEQPSLNTEMHVIRSRQLLERLVDQQDLLDDPEFNSTLRETPPYSVRGVIHRLRAMAGFPPAPEPALTTEEQRQLAVDEVLARMSVANPEQTFVFQIRFDADSAQKAARLANAIADLYINDQLLLKEAAAERTITFLESRATQLQAELGETELAVKNFTVGTELVSPEALAAMTRQVKELRDRVAALQADTSTRVAQVALIDQIDPANPSAPLIEELELPAVSNGLARLQSGQLDEAGFAGLLQSTHARLENEARQSRQQADSLTDAVADLETQIETQSQDLLTLQQLQREAEATRELYSFFLTSLKEAQVQQGTLLPDARLLSSAVVPREPARPRMQLSVVLGALVGAFIAGMVVLIREFRQNGFRTSEELAQATGHVVLGQIPLGPTRRRQRLISYLSSSANSAFVESVRDFRTSLLLANSDKKPQVILLSSSVPGEGKTTLSLSLSRNLSGLGKKVLLIEADIRRRTFSEYFDAAEQPKSLVDAVMDGGEIADIVMTSEILGCDVIMGGATKANAADFFSSDAFNNFLTRARETYDHIVIDSPPVLVVPDARIIAQVSDAVVYICHWNKTTKAQLRMGIASFENVGVRIDGTVLTQIDAKGMKRYGYGGRYGGYGSYGNAYYDQ